MKKKSVALHRLKIRQTDQKHRSQEESLRSEDGVALARGQSGERVTGRGQHLSGSADRGRMIQSSDDNPAGEGTGGQKVKRRWHSVSNEMDMCTGSRPGGPLAHQYSVVPYRMNNKKSQGF